MDLLWTLNDGKNRRIFLGLNFSIPQFSGIGKFGKYFLGWVDNLKVPPYVDRVILFVFVFVVVVFLPGEREVMYRSNRSFNMPTPPPPGIPRAFHTIAVPGRGEFDYQCLPGGGEFNPQLKGGEFELHPRLAWRAIMGDEVSEDFRGKDCAVLANWL